MEQKRYSLKIVSFLLKNKSHGREIARILNTNPMTISRKINELFKENIIDFDLEGKNKVYFIKKTAEAKAYVFMAEECKLIKLLKKYPSLRSIIEKIQKHKKIKLAIIFGSYAKEIAKNDSDIDIYIETKDKNLKKEIELFDSKLSIKIGKYDKNNNLIKEIEKNHILIKGIEEYYEKSKFFN